MVVNIDSQYLFLLIDQPFDYLKKGENSLNETLLKKINEAGRIHMVPAKLRGQFVLRLAVCSRYTESRDIVFAWQELSSHADNLLGQPQLL